jgi:nucleoside 2-deoxyribosyltransferase
MKIYIASSYKNYKEVLELAEKLRAIGVTPLCAWASTEHASTQIGKDLALSADNAVNSNEASRDLAEIDEAAVVLLLSNGVPSVSGGMHFECGYAHGLGKQIYVLGKRSTVFHWLYGVTQFDTFEELVEWLMPIKKWSIAGNNS